MSKIMNGSLSRKDGKLLLGWERVGGGGGEMTLHVLAYYPRGSKNNKKKVVVFPPAPLAKLAFLSVG